MKQYNIGLPNKVDSGLPQNQQDGWKAKPLHCEWSQPIKIPATPTTRCYPTDAEIMFT